MKIPRDLEASRLISVLQRLGYVIVRQSGSHIRMFHADPPPHHLTVPNHSTLKVGLLQALLKEVAERQGLPLERLVEML
ncbi:type II toxin-antitoxin system HicA family toxin [Meiothermus sp. CFH 77666]|uniref:type II toxin-antitoxin system HicA family toxin n=1 Tax=Meiothermus sp. CFH 77666 TaxID=2817942 RepID=UPI001AA0A2BA|nr:type II toxin-antitoxin system HicA family toxin [Meiothermus sp. CFH 77666]MBO1438490.1 type II toxin-antitoxin system HicA family toxin [Meiothermus sp. CFH 77666]